jgi:hypothetical protein
MRGPGYFLESGASGQSALSGARPPFSSRQILYENGSKAVCLKEAYIGPDES